MPPSFLKHGPYGDHFLQLAIWGAGTGTGILQLILDYLKKEGQGK